MGVCRDSVQQDGSNRQRERRQEGPVVWPETLQTRAGRAQGTKCTPFFFNGVKLFETTNVFFSLNKRPPLRSAMLLPTLQTLQTLHLLRGLLGFWVPGAQHTLLRGQRGCKQGHGLGCLAFVAQGNGECVGCSEACWVVGPQRALGLG